MAASLSTKQGFREGWFAPITAANVEKVVNDVGKGWYVVGVIHLLGFCLLSWMSGVLYASWLDGIFCLIAGYFLIYRKSRALSWILFPYSLYIGAVTVLSLFGVIQPQGGTNIILSVMVIAVAWRGLRATSVYQRKAGYVTAWKHVLWIWASIIVLGSINFVFTSIFLKIVFPLIAVRLVGFIVMTVVGVFAGALLIVLTRYFPFHRSAGGSVAAEAITAS